MFIGHGEEAHGVEQATMSEHSDLTLRFADGCVLETLSDIGYSKTSDQLPGECWRLFRAGIVDQPHLVSRAGGIAEM